MIIQVGLEMPIVTTLLIMKDVTLMVGTVVDLMLTHNGVQNVCVMKILDVSNPLN